MNKILNLPDKSISVVAASSGNHGAAVAYSLRNLKMKGLVYVPENAVSSKVKLMKKYGVEIRYSGNDSLIAESSAILYAEENNLSFVSPYNDIDVISGQGTIGVEMINQLKDLDVVFITVGGGGLISGVGGYLKSINSNIKIIGCSPENSPVMKISLNRGKIIEFDSLPTLSEGSAGGIEKDSITYNFCEEFIDNFYLEIQRHNDEDEKLFELAVTTIDTVSFSFNIILTTSYHPPYSIDLVSKGFPANYIEQLPLKIL